MIRVSRMIRSKAVPGRTIIPALAFAAMFCSGCSSNKSGGPSTPGADVGFQLVNATSVPISVYIDGPGFTTMHATLGGNGFQPVEIPAGLGDLITITASGAPYTTGSGGCQVSQEMIDGYPNMYGQINIQETGVAGQPLVVVCSSGWQ